LSGVGPKGDEVTGSWRELISEELHSLFSSPSIVRIIESRRMSLEGHIACIERRRMHIGYCSGTEKVRDIRET
jgi:hypothetical protein